MPTTPPQALHFPPSPSASFCARGASVRVRVTTRPSREKWRRPPPACVPASPAPRGMSPSHCPGPGVAPTESRIQAGERARVPHGPRMFDVFPPRRFRHVLRPRHWGSLKGTQALPSLFITMSCSPSSHGLLVTFELAERDNAHVQCPRKQPPTSSKTCRLYAQ